MSKKKARGEPQWENTSGDNSYNFESNTITVTVTSEEVAENRTDTVTLDSEEQYSLTEYNTTESKPTPLNDLDFNSLHESVPAKKTPRLYNGLWFPKGSVVIRNCEKTYQFVSKQSLERFLTTLEFEVPSDSRTGAEAVRNAVLNQWDYAPIGLAKGYEVKRGEYSEVLEKFVNIIWISPNVRVYYDYSQKKFVKFMPETIIL